MSTIAIGAVRSCGATTVALGLASTWPAHRRVLLVEDLYLRDGQYEYAGGVNWNAIAALALGAGSALSGLIVPTLRVLYDYSWFVGFAVSFAAYYWLMRGHSQEHLVTETS